MTLLDKAALVLAVLLSLAGCKAAETAPASPPTASVDLLPEINALRLARGLPVMERSLAATAAAGRHAADLQRTGGLGHQGSDGSTPGERLSREGQTWCRVAENVARGQGSGQEVLADWTLSPRHRANLLGRYTALGTARAGDIWVAIFLSPC